MSKNYQVNDRVLVSDSIHKFCATITAIHGRLYRVDYDLGGYDWLLADELEPMHPGVVYPKGYTNFLVKRGW